MTSKNDESNFSDDVEGCAGKLGGVRKMTFGWINAINAAAVMWLVVVNMVVAKRGIAGSMESARPLTNVFEQVGRYACMAFMLFPVATNGWKFGFRTVAEMFSWLGLTVVLLVVYTFLWTRKKSGGKAVLYGLAIVPAGLFFINGILLRHWLLLVSALVFGICHLRIVRENVEED